MNTEHRQTPRQEAHGAVMITPNGHGHDAEIFDISAGGARVGVPNDWTPADGASLRVFFLADSDDPIMLHGHVARVAIDHLGVAFEPDQEGRILALMRRLR